MYDESGQCEKVSCLICGADSDEGCPHLLMFYDVTFSQCEGGVAYDHKDRFESQVSGAFTRLLAEGAKPTWSHYEVGEVWDALLEEGFEDPEDIVLPTKQFLDLYEEVLVEAGGLQHPGSLVSESGGRCASSVRLLYADDPEQVCKDAEKVFDEWLKPEEPKKKKSRKRS